ncbi:hypothetical protein [Rhabdochromatium marinum]|uniref:hypothetical protein n=1 Tax=Rhabdochromatium marinum TaxID=48729 RepID=UPI001908BBDA|nr:hypothetical protein [Rhabdochromatium marinum]
MAILLSSYRITSPKHGLFQTSRTTVSARQFHLAGPLCRLVAPNVNARELSDAASIAATQAMANKLKKQEAPQALNTGGSAHARVD